MEAKSNSITVLRSIKADGALGNASRMVNVSHSLLNTIIVTYSIGEIYIANRKKLDLLKSLIKLINNEKLM